MAAALTALSPYHIRGMTDVTGAPGVEIATTAVEFFGDNSIRFTDAAGNARIIRDQEAMVLLLEVLGL